MREQLTYQTTQRNGLCFEKITNKQWSKIKKKRNKKIWTGLHVFGKFEIRTQIEKPAGDTPGNCTRSQRRKLN